MTSQKDGPRMWMIYWLLALITWQAIQIHKLAGYVQVNSCLHQVVITTEYVVFENSEDRQEYRQNLQQHLSKCLGEK